MVKTNIRYLYVGWNIKSNLLSMHQRNKALIVINHSCKPTATSNDISRSIKYIMSYKSMSQSFVCYTSIFLNLIH